ncbi:hypothetical protein FF011L_16380 [Roseimaritima multifibrata]|uniref:Uncharacterized protein n=1 Tax=Roseimaritima multifibrata TaxID=1930274 RepID=A0A517MDB6_9BACT|nr:hypothetical protein [Roseimaritima multifibrata]QDS92884.1 hypothetical protein FF011L_16380 [Roseimaritima multifibrata]
MEQFTDPPEAGHSNGTPARLGCFPGCLPIAGITIAAALLLYVNGGVVKACYDALAEQYPRTFGKEDVAQIVMFVAPVLLLIVEWTTLDFLRRMLFSRRA